MSPDAVTDAPERTVDTVVIGAGLAGLTAAWRLRDRDILVLERTDRLGGRLQSERRGAYWLNLGAHMFGGPETAVGRLVAEAGLATRPITGHLMGIAYKGRVLTGVPPVVYPLRLPLSVAGRLSFLRMGWCLRQGAAALLKRLPQQEGEAPADQRARLLAYMNDRSLRDLVGPLHPEADLILRTITERTSASPDVMAAGYGLTSFTNVWSKAAPGRHLVGGAEELPRVLAAKLGRSIVTGARVLSVQQDGTGAITTYATTEGPVRVRSLYVVVAAPAFEAARIIADLPNDTRAALADLPYGPFLSVAVETAEPGSMPWDGSYAIATPGLSFGVLFNQATTARVGPRRPGGSLMLFRGAAGAGDLLGESDGVIERRFLADLDGLFPGTRRHVREVRVQRWPDGAPYARPGRARLQAALTRDLGRVVLAGDYLEFPNMEAAVRTGTEAAAVVLAKTKAATAKTIP